METNALRNTQLYEFIQANKVLIAFAAGILVSSILRSICLAIFNALTNPSARDRRGLYSLDHAKLNLSLPLPSMWMNMGYWKRQDLLPASDQSPSPNPTDEPLDMSYACPNLLAKVLEVAGLLLQSPQLTNAVIPSERPEPSTPSLSSISILDIGFGCGDQTLALLELARSRISAVPASRAFPFFGASAHLQLHYTPRVAAYVGLTQDARQLACANDAVSRWRRKAAVSRASGGGRRFDDDEDDVLGRFRLFCADGSRPERWDEEIREAVRRLGRVTEGEKAEADVTVKTQTWLLGLDSLYHMRPSRRPLLSYAHRELGASFMAFDLLLAPSASRPQMTTWQGLLLRLVCLLTSTPRSNLMTPDEYTAMLVRAGYRAQDVVIEDISEHVFAPLAEFLARQGRELGVLGLGLGAFRVARWIFGWWARTGVVRGCVVVARHEGHVHGRAR